MKKTLTAVMILASIGVISGCGGSDETSLDKGYKSLASSDYRAANIEFKSILQKNPDAVEARVGLAKIAIANRDYSGAITELEKAKSVPNLDNTLEHEINTLISRAYHKEQLFGDEILSIDAKGEPEILYYQISENLGREDLTEAKRLFSLLPKESGFKDLSSVLFVLTEKTLGDAIEVFPEIDTGDPIVDSESSILRLNVALQANDMELALSSMKRYHELNPKDNQRRLQYAHMLVNSSKESDAKSVIAPLIKSFPSNGLINEIASRIAYSEKKYKEAISYASIATVSSPNAIMPRVVSAYSSVQLDNPKEALSNLEFIIDKLPPQHPAQRLYIRLKTSTGDFDGVADKALNFDNVQPGDAALYSGIGLELMRRGNTAQAEALAEKAAEASKNAGEKAPNLGLLQLSLNQGDLAIQTLEDAFNEDPTSTMASNSLAAGYLASKNYEKASELADVWMSEGKVEGDMLKGVVFSRTGNLKGAIVQFEKVIEQKPEHFMARAGLIENLVKDDQDGKAQEKLKVWLKDDSMVGLFRNYMAAMKDKHGDKGVDTSAQQLEKWISEGGLNSDLVLYLSAQTQFMSKNSDLAMSKLKSLEGTKVSEQSEYWLLRATLAEKEKNVDETILAYTSWQEVAPSDPMPLMGEVRVLAELGKYDDAVKRLDETLYRFENKVPGLLLKSQLLMKQGKWVTMERQVDKLPINARDSLIGKGLQGVLLAQDERFKEAEIYIKPLVLETANEDFLRWLVYSMERQGKHSEVLVLLNSHLAKRPSSSLANFVLANEAISKENYEDAEVKYKKALGDSKSNPLLMNNLSYVLSKNGKFEEAIKFGKKAVEDAGDNPSYIETLVSVYIESGDLDAARGVVEAAKDRDVKFNDALRNTELKLSKM